MISVVTAYYNRKVLFLRTLESLAWFGGGDFEVVAVDDGSDEEERIEDLAERFQFLRVIRLEPGQKWYSNPCIPFNLAIRKAAGEAIILQNPECLHAGEVVRHVRENLTNGVYLSYACYALSEVDTASLGTAAAKDVQTLAEAFELKACAPQQVGVPGWYNHSRLNPRGYHFCAAITRRDLERLGGFDERYAKGAAYDDDDLFHRVRKAGIEVRFVDDPHVLHQHHYVNPDNGIPCDRVKRNEKIFRFITAPALSFNPNGENWGDPGSAAAKEANEAMDTLILGNSELHERVLEGERWRSYAGRLDSLLGDTVEALQILRQAVESVVALTRTARESFVGRLIWRNKQQRQLEKILKWMEKAGNYETQGRPGRAAQEYVRALSESSSLAEGLSRGWKWRCIVDQMWVKAVHSQVRVTENWWKNFQKRKSEILRSSPACLPRAAGFP